MVHLKYNRFTIMDLYAGLVNRDRCLNCGGSGQDVTEIDGEAKIEPCSCVDEADEILKRHFEMFLQCMQEILFFRLNIEGVEWSDKVEGGNVLEYVQTVVGDVVNSHLPGRYSIVGANIDEDNIVHMVVTATPGDSKNDRTFSGETFAQAFRLALNELK